MPASCRFRTRTFRWGFYGATAVEQAGFAYDRPKGQFNCVTVPPA